MCVLFFLCVCVCYLLMPLFGRRLAGLSVNLSLPLVLRQALDGSVHQVAPNQAPFWEGSWWASLSVSLDCALICYTLVELDSPESVV